MSAPRFFVDERCAPDLRVTLSAEDAHHALQVLRLRDGDAVVIVNDGIAWDATLATSERGRADAIIAVPREETGGELPSAVTVIQALIKGNKFDEVVEKVVELGARRIVPVRCERGYGEAGDAKLSRWRRIARSAAQQSRRRTLPSVEQPLPWNDAVHAYGGSALLVAYEDAQPGTFAIAATRVKRAPAVTIAIGPEGGLTDAEVKAARGAGASIVSLGPSVLRTETAGAAMLSALAATAGWW
jgi:16S rRNA (uracil1498-N3)-methyltransferase